MLRMVTTVLVMIMAIMMIVMIVMFMMMIVLVMMIMAMMMIITHSTYIAYSKALYRLINIQLNVAKSKADDEMIVMTMIVTINIFYFPTLDLRR